MARIINTATDKPTDTLGKLAVYNGMDCLTLPEIHEGLQSEMRPDHKAVYAFEMDLHSALIQMAFAGIPVDTGKQGEMIRHTQGEKIRIESYFHQLCTAVGYYDYYRDIARIQFAEACHTRWISLPQSWDGWLATPLTDRRAWKQVAGEKSTKTFQKWLKELDQPFNPNSGAQKLRLFYHFFGIDTNEETIKRFPDFPPPWGRTKGIKEFRTRNSNNEYTPGVDRDTIEKLRARTSDDSSEAVYWAQPFFNLCLYHADLAKTLQFLNCKLDLGWFYSSFGCVTETGRLSSKKSAYDSRGWNAQNVSPPLRIIFTSPLGQKSATPDYEQIESRMVAARCFIQFGATNYIAATECGDLHSLACSMAYEKLPWPEDFKLEWTIKHGPFPLDMVRAAKQIAKQELYRGKTYRDGSKTMGHAKNYYGKAAEVAKRAHIPVKYVEHYYEVFDAIFPEIPFMWHPWIIEQIQVYGEFTTIFGRPRKFFGRSSDDATIREAIAHDGQSPAADYTNQAMLRIHKAALSGELPVELFLQKHDEIGVRYKEADEQLVTTKMIELMEQRFTLTAPNGTTREWTVPAEMLVGWNLGHRNDTNPDGLIALFGTDDRVRQHNPWATGLLEMSA